MMNSLNIKSDNKHLNIQTIDHFIVILVSSELSSFPNTN